MLPNGLYIGTDKAGSTWLAEALAAHPSVVVPAAKDLQFFSDDATFSRGLDWYDRRFPEGTAVRIEVCHDYLSAPAAPARVHAALGDAVRLIAFLRRPSERALSAYLNARRHGLVPDTLHAAMLDFPFLTEPACYGSHLERWLQHFARDRFLVMAYDELVADPGEVWARVQGHLAIEHQELPMRARGVVRGAGEARSLAVSRALKGAATMARRRGLVSIVGRAKRSRLVERVVYRPAAYHLTDEDRAALEGVDRSLQPEWEKVDALFGTQLSDLWSGRRPGWAET
jgi:hypothetical protein